MSKSNYHNLVEQRLKFHVVEIDCKQGESVKISVPFVNDEVYKLIDRLYPSCTGCTKDVNPYRDRVVATYQDKTKDSEFVTDEGVKAFVQFKRYINILYYNDPGTERTPRTVENENGAVVPNYLGRPWEQIVLDITVRK